MGLFGNSVQKKLALVGFEPTGVIFQAPALSFLPSFFDDARHRRWAVVFPAAEPTVHEYAVVKQCEVVENVSVDVLQDMDKKELFKAIVANPSAVSRVNAGRDGKYCTKLNVVLTIQDSKGKASTLEIPLLTQEVPRKSKSYELLRKQADTICKAFNNMRALSRLSQCSSTLFQP